MGLLDYIDAVEQALGRPVQKRMLPMQKGDAPATWSCPDLLRRLTDYVPATGVREGVANFVEWYRDDYR